MNQESSPETILEFLVVGLHRAYLATWSMQNGVTRYVSPGPASLMMNHLYAWQAHQTNLSSISISISWNDADIKSCYLAPVGERESGQPIIDDISCMTAKQTTSTWTDLMMQHRWRFNGLLYRAVGVLISRIYKKQ